MFFIIWLFLTALVGIVMFFVGGKWKKSVMDKEAAAADKLKSHFDDLKQHVSQVGQNSTQALANHISAEVSKAGNVVSDTIKHASGSGAA